MTTTLTISAPLAMAAVPTLIAIGGVVVGIALRGYLTTGIEVARLNAVNDDKTARWLWLRGYRSTPHAGPELTPELTADNAVTGEVLAIDGVDTEADAHHDDTDRAGMGRVLLGLAKDNVDAMARGVADALNWVARGVGYGIEWIAYLLKSQKRRDAEFAETYHRALERARDEEKPRGLSNVVAGNWITAEQTPEPEPVRIVRRDRFRPAGETGQFPYVKVAGAPRHAAPEPEFPAINATVPTQRTGDEA